MPRESALGALFGLSFQSRASWFVCFSVLVWFGFGWLVGMVDIGELGCQVFCSTCHLNKQTQGLKQAHDEGPYLGSALKSVICGSSPSLSSSSEACLFPQQMGPIFVLPGVNGCSSHCRGGAGLLGE